MVFEYSYHMYMTDLYTQKFSFPRFRAQHNLYVSLFVSNFFDQQLLVERKKTWQPETESSLSCWGLVLLGRALCSGRLGTRRHFEGLCSRGVDGGERTGDKKRLGWNLKKNLWKFLECQVWFLEDDSKWYLKNISVCSWVEMLQGKVKNPFT